MLTVVIPSWNRCDLVTTCLASLQKQTWRAFHTVVVDDASEDDTCEAIKRDFPEVEIVRNATRSGFARSINAGLRVARTPWVFLLNNDITLEPDALRQLMDTAKTTQADLLTPLMLWQDAPDMVYAAGDFVRKNGRPESHGFRVPRDSFSPQTSVFGVTFGAALLSQRALREVGELDASFGAYFEDADWCCRARLKGFRARCVPDAVVYHVGSASIQKELWWRARQCWQNHALLVVKNFPAPLLFGFLPEILRERCHQARRLLSAARAERGAAWAVWVYLAAQCALCRRLPGALIRRRRIQASRTVSPGIFADWLEEEDGHG